VLFCTLDSQRQYSTVLFTYIGQCDQTTTTGFHCSCIETDGIGEVQITETIGGQY
jgi:hypothetical protein